MIAAPFFMATTYVIKEGNNEVGRYDEADGKTGIVEVAADKPKPVPMKKETKLQYSQDMGYTAKLVETGRRVPDRKRKMLVSGRVLDLLTLHPVPRGKLVFSADLEKYEVPVEWSGSFSASIPKPEKTALSVTYQPPKGYRANIGMHSSGELAKIPAKERRRMAEGIVFSKMSPSSWVNLEFSAVPEKLPPRQFEDNRDNRTPSGGEGSIS